jgi:hypothetical protein
MKLSEQQVTVIREVLLNSGITHDSLRNDVLDHLCCVVEIKISKETDFATSLDEAIRELAPEGLRKLQDETVFLLNSNKIMLMKKFMYSIGLATTIAMTMGLTFKILHMPGADELFNIGFFGFTLLFLPMLTIDRFKQKIHAALTERLRLVLGFISAVTIGSSVLFKIFHYQGADVLLLVGISVFSFGFLPFLFFNLYKKSIS